MADPNPTIQPLPGTDPDLYTEFVRNVRVTGSCWEWTGSKAHFGYGRLWRGGATGRAYRAHRISYEMFVGTIPPGKWVLHRCDNPPCVRPDHLFIGTHQDNMADCQAKGRLATGERNGSKTHPERVPRGDRHSSRTHPERVARGKRHGSVTHPERLARGDANGARRHPESLARGDRNGARLYPERLLRGDDHPLRKNPGLAARGENSAARKHPESLRRGDDHWSKLHPDRITRGSRHGCAKLTESQVVEIRRFQSTESVPVQAERYGVSKDTIYQIRKGTIWRHPECFPETLPAKETE